MLKVVFLVENLTQSQQNFYLLNSINDLCRRRSDIGVMIGFEDLTPVVMPPLCPVLHISEFYSFDGAMISTSYHTARLMTSMMGTTKKFYYVYDLPWVRPQILPFEPFHKVFTDKSITLVARSIDHQGIISRAFNREVPHVVEEFDFESIIKIITE